MKNFKFGRGLIEDENFILPLNLFISNVGLSSFMDAFANCSSITNILDIPHEYFGINSGIKFFKNDQPKKIQFGR